MPEGGASPGPEISRRTLFKLGAVGAGAVVAVGAAELSKRAINAVEQGYRAESGMQRNIVEVDGAKVELSVVESRPKEKEADPTKAVIHLAPWSWAAETPIIREGGQKIADGMGENTYTISTRTDKIGPDALFIEAQGIAQFILDRGFQEVTIFSHSEGGIKAVNLASILETNSPQVRINGVVLLDPMGMDQKSVVDLARSFIGDIVAVNPKEFKKAGQLPPEGGAVQFALSLWQDMKFFGGPWAIGEELKAMARLNPRLKTIKAPVLLMTGEQDFISDFRRYFPAEEIEKRLKAPISDEQLRSWIETKSKWEHLPRQEQSKFRSKEEFAAHYMQAYRKQEEMARYAKARNQYLKEVIIPAINKGLFILATNPASSHGGLVDTRFEKVVSLVKKIFPHWQKQPATI